MNLLERIATLANVSNVPMMYIENNKEKYQSPNFPYLTRLIEATVRKSINFNKNVECVLAKDILGYGLLRIKETDGLLIIGPVATIACDTLRAQYILKSYGISIAETGMLLSYFKSVPIYSLQKFANLIVLSAQLINNDDIKIVDLLPYEYLYPKITAETEDTSYEEVLHDGQAYENRLYSCIELGQVEKLKLMKQNSGEMTAEGTLARDPLRHKKNLCICSTALAARHAVNGGLNYNVAMTIADGFIVKIDFAPDYKSIGILHTNMLATYAKRVAEVKTNYSFSSITYKVKNYIDKNITEKISVEKISDSLKVSRTYLSSCFKKETGKNLSDFIMEQKINEAQILLRTSSASAVTIAHALSFSSQSYFQANFKTIVGMTPKEYRKKYAENYSI